MSNSSSSTIQTVFLPTEIRLEHFCFVVAANAILTCPNKRQAYDRYGAGWNGAPSAPIHGLVDRRYPPLRRPRMEHFRRAAVRIRMILREAHPGRIGSNFTSATARGGLQREIGSEIFVSNGAFVGMISVLAGLAGW